MRFRTAEQRLKKMLNEETIIMNLEMAIKREEYRAARISEIEFRELSNLQN